MESAAHDQQSARCPSRLMLTRGVDIKLESAGSFQTGCGHNQCGSEERFHVDLLRRGCRRMLLVGFARMPIA